MFAAKSFNQIVLFSYFILIKNSMPVCVLVTQSCLTLWNPKDCSPPGSSVHGILQARILEWVSIPFSRDLSTTLSFLDNQKPYSISEPLFWTSVLKLWHILRHRITTSSWPSCYSQLDPKRLARICPTGPLQSSVSPLPALIPSVVSKRLAVPKTHQQPKCSPSLHSWCLQSMVCAHGSLYTNAQAVIYAIVQNWKESRCVSVGEWLNKLLYIHLYNGLPPGTKKWLNYWYSTTIWVGHRALWNFSDNFSDKSQFQKVHNSCIQHP